MTEEKTYTLGEAQRYFAVETNKLTWGLLGKADRTEAENDRLIQLAHASAFHWSEIGTAVNYTRGEWLISHVYAVLNRPEAALFHAQRCLQICLDNAFDDFDLAYAYEAVARAAAANSKQADYEKYVALAQTAGEQIKDAEDKSIFVGDFEAGPWYDLK